ncbi:DUF4212 domain-containing protein [Salinibacillus xinjiangensis]|uniref:DUF4212 domain-containing protein n=1 Tax=Salinibacillus xinjiangensis TaxID=1229268 RepID=A0A6G1X480_9BACI|nr:DUF4212 domain-containing protein [Salinibacillus xinjiangensis]MRG85729.1 DUF4212 domain-containing protein [Salinibacillus xinjiangensis]
MLSNEQLSEKQREYWKRNIRLIVTLLIIWASVSLLAGIILAKPFSNIMFFEVPLSFWFAQQGSIIVFIFLIFTYAIKMDRLDREFGVEEVILTEEKDSKGDES